MKKIFSILLIALTIVSLSACKESDSDIPDSTSSTFVESSIQKTQYLNHDETQVYDWKCDIAPSKIKVFSGSPIEGFLSLLMTSYMNTTRRLLSLKQKNVTEKSTPNLNLFISTITTRWIAFPY